MINNGLFSSVSENWETPQAFFDLLDREFHFTLDVCASPKNAKCSQFFTKADDALIHHWVGVCWMNPPYGRVIGDWIQKAHQEALQGATVVCLIPARTDTRWWHEDVMRASEIRFVKGRLKFLNRTLPSFREHQTFKVSPAPFPSAVVIFTPNSEYNSLVVRTMEQPKLQLPLLREVA